MGPDGAARTMIIKMDKCLLILSSCHGGFVASGSSSAHQFMQENNVPYFIDEGLPKCHQCIKSATITTT